MARRKKERKKWKDLKIRGDSRDINQTHFVDLGES